MKRTWVACAALLLTANPNRAAIAEPELTSVKCASLLKAYGKPTYEELSSHVVDYVLTNGAIEVGSESSCNIMGLVMAECRASPAHSIQAAIDRLYAKRDAGVSLPKTKACGA